MRNCFTPLEYALEEIEVVEMDDHLSVLEELQDFDYAQAVCYDPSETPTSCNARI